MLSWILKKRRLTYLLANNQITSNINEDKTVEHTKLNKNQIRENLIGLTQSANT